MPKDGLFSSLLNSILRIITEGSLESAGASEDQMEHSATVSAELPSLHSEEDSIQVELYRDRTGPEGTFGRLIHESGWECVTLELPWRDNLPEISCIPPGVYEFQRDFSPARGRQVFEALEVPDRSQIQIHPANLGGDVALGYKSQILGCIALGETVSVFAPGSIPGQFKKQLGITNSAATVRDFEDVVGAKGFRMRIHE